MHHLNQRLYAAEKEGRRWRRITCTLGAAAMAMVFVAAKKEVVVPEFVIARKFVAVNERDEPVAVMGHVKNTGLLGVSASDGTLMFVATVTDQGRGVISTYNHLGRQLVKMGSAMSGQGEVTTSRRERGTPIATKALAGTSRAGG